MVRLAFSTIVICAASIVALVASTRPLPPLQPIQFRHKLHLDYFLDGSRDGHRASMISMHKKAILEELDDEEIVNEMMEMVEQGNCTLCHGDFDENVENMAKLGHCAECHRVFLEHDWEGREDERPCMGCHNTVVQSSGASIPNTDTCAACHPLPLQGDRDKMSPEEAKLIKYIEKENEQERRIPWVRVYDYLPGDIVFSHERHVEMGRVKCRECHGLVEQAEGPLAFEVKLSMEDCMDCHEHPWVDNGHEISVADGGHADAGEDDGDEVHGADNDCLACHK